MDESGIDESLQRNYARAPRGKQVITDVQGKKPLRTSIIAAYLKYTKQIIALYVFEGYTDSKRFNGRIKECLLPVLKKRLIIIMDNALFHKSKLTRELIVSSGCKLLFQPPYSPDLNPIVQQWAIIKWNYRKFKHRGYKHDTAIDDAFLLLL